MPKVLITEKTRATAEAIISDDSATTTFGSLNLRKEVRSAVKELLEAIVKVETAPQPVTLPVVPKDDTARGARR